MQPERERDEAEYMFGLDCGLLQEREETLDSFLEEGLWFRDDDDDDALDLERDLEREMVFEEEESSSESRDDGDEDEVRDLQANILVGSFVFGGSTDEFNEAVEGVGVCTKMRGRLSVDVDFEGIDVKIDVTAILGGNATKARFSVTVGGGKKLGT